MRKYQKTSLQLMILFLFTLVFIILSEGRSASAASIPDGYLARWGFNNSLEDECGKNSLIGYYNSTGNWNVGAANYSVNSKEGSACLDFNSDISYFTNSINDYNYLFTGISQNAFTFSTLLYFDPVNIGKDQYITYLQGNIAMVYNYGIPGKIGYYISDGGGTPSYAFVSSNNNIDGGQWYHVVAVWNGVTMKLYVNGIPQTMETTPTFPVNILTNPVYTPSDLQFSYADSTTSFRGFMDETIFYNSVLSDTQILGIYNYYFAKAPTDIGMKNLADEAVASLTIPENTASGVKIGGLTTTDTDSSSFTYSLVAGDGDTDNASFTIEGSDLKLNTVPDYENKTSYSIRIQTQDDTGLTYSEAFTISITDINDAPTDITLSNSSIAENSASGMTIGTLSGTDPDIPLSTLTYSLPAGIGDNASFSLDGSTLKLAFVPNHEVKDSYTITARVSDDEMLTCDKQFTILITDVNEAPTGLSLSSTSITEHNTVGTVIGSFTGTDPDAGASFTYSLISGEGDTDNGSFTIDVNALKLGFVPDFETDGSYSILVRVSDGSLTFDQIFTITIIDGNDPPTDITITGSIDENSAPGSTAGVLGSSDPNSLNTFTYSKVAGTGDTDNASFSITDDVLKLDVSANHETKSSYSVRIRTTDNFGLSYEKALTIAITDVNEAPTSIVLSSNTIAENSAIGTTIGTLLGADPDAGTTYTYSLPAGEGDNASFTITETSLKLAVVPDYETGDTYSITVRVSDGSLIYDEVFVISISDANDAPTDIALSWSSVLEHCALGTIVGTLSSEDQDGGDFTYSLVAGDGSTDNGSFSISDDILQVAVSPNFEVNDSYSIRIRTTDSTGLYYEKILTISITDGQDPPTDISIESESVDENSAIGTSIGTLSTADTNVAGPFAYTLVSGAGDTDNTSFTITSDSLRLAFVPNYELKNSYSIRIRTENTTTGFYIEKAFTILITNVNEYPTNIDLSSNTIAENSAIGTTIGTLSGTDPDAETTFTYSLPAGGENESFTISGTSLLLKVVPDYETDDTYIITVRVSDGDLTFDEVFTISISDANDAPTDITLSGSSVLEHCAIGTEVGSLSSADQDSSTFTYSLVAGDGATDNGSFSISGSTLQVAVPPDFEVSDSYSVRIRTTDSTSLNYEKVLTISITDGDDPPTDISITSEDIAENSAIGTTIGTLSSIGSNGAGTFTYTLVSGDGATDNASFTITSDSLKLAFIPNYEDKDSYSIRIRTENVATGFYYEKAFTISINNVNEAPSDVSLSETSVAENTAYGTPVGTLSGTDPDAGSTFTYSLVAGDGDTDNACFTVSGNELKLAVVPDYETGISYTIRVRVSDQYGLTYTEQITITVINGNDAPTDIGLSNISIIENVAIGSTIGIISSTDLNGGIFTYSLVTGEGSTDNANVTISGNELKLAIEPDFETNHNFNIRIRTVDDGGLSYVKAFVISINDINEAPSNIIISKANIPEDSANGSLVGTFTGIDEDAADSSIYTLVLGDGSDDNGSFIISGNELRTTFIPDYETKPNYSVRVRVTDAGGLSYEKSFAITVTYIAPPSPPAPPAPPAPSTTEETLTLDVTNGTTDESVAQIEIVRTTSPEGIINDSITLDEEKAEETIEKLTDEGAETARIVVPKSEEEISEVNVTIPTASLDLLSDTDLSLEIETEDVMISIPNTSLDTAKEEIKEDLYFNILPVTDEEEKQDVSDNANKDGMLIQMLGEDLAIIGTPMEIETNMPQTTVDIILPLTGVTIPEDKKEREILFSKFGIYVEHSDGEREVIKGEVVEIRTGVYGIKFSVSKFSLFSVFKDERSNQCKVTSVKSPTDTNMNGYLFISKVSYKTTSVKLSISTSVDAKWKLYSDKACTKEIKNKVKLKTGLNKFYIKVVAEDGVSYKIYTLYITRGKQR